MNRFLIVGLGNPGPKYDGTRHNIGFAVVQRLAQRYGVSVNQTKFHSHYTSARIASKDAVLLMPQTFMNLSGKAVLAAAQFYQIPENNVIVIHDEIDLPVGQLRIKFGGGHGGHNGLRDIIAKSGSRDFVRIRVGVDRPQHGDVSNHVLSAFRAEEEIQIANAIDDASDAVETIIQDGYQAAQNRFN